mmetsp:Transcript_8735/g.11822  ORF Transcript_8735/g.11822 Transcript_8735/m.11822 type:complete len:1130 (+) Transcript_8735:104-3493(+)|eukprot:CAMPEP_0196574410 /NCGR_PEP_ID=MMETSP1081-20130531/4128_1 /TAXON_ID=36882 /ORGANISM="Pyramimonas amylifera, Strain CCMP720" /LENGTH=1129 /DNA_ID=CAMNT_0041892423 /DNA_START=171 /DNA_END=3560 /DNA_ORIENTATION=+
MAQPSASDLETLLDTSQPAAFEIIIQTLTSPSNEERDRAEGVFNACKKHPALCTMQLVQVLRRSTDIGARAMCAVLLRKVLTKDMHEETGNTMWPLLPEPTKAGVKSELLLCIQEETERSILKKVCDTVGEIATVIFEEGAWPELLPFMFQCVQSGNDRHRESALLIFGQLAPVLVPSLSAHLSTLHQVLGHSMQSTVVFDVRIAALKAAINFILSLENSKECDQFQSLVPSMLETLAAALNSGEESQAQEALEALIELADNHPRFLRSQLDPVLNAMILIAEADQLEDSTRNYAVEFLLTLAEARAKAPGMLRKCPHFVQRLFTCLLGFLLDVDDSPEWYTADSDEECEDGSGERYDVGQEGLDRLAMALGGKTILPLASQVLPGFLQDPDWKKRHAALIALSQIAEGCSKLMVKQLGAVAEMCLGCMCVDPHARVRWAAIHAVGQTCTDLGPDLQQQEHARLLPALLQVMDDHAQPRVQAHASAAVVNFSENCSPEIMRPYMDQLITKLMLLLQSGKKLVMEGALTALASVADCAQEEFQKYYDGVMPFLKNILMTATDKTHRMLRAKALECLSLVGMAVGKERFRADARQVMDLLVQLQSSTMESDDPTVSYMLQAWARLCKCLGAEFLPYLQVVMPPLLKSASLKTEMAINYLDEDDQNEDDDDWETIELGDKRISIRTSVLEEKATACNMLYCYADELKEGFYPYVEEVLKMMVPLLRFYVHEEVRKAAVTALPELLRGAKLAVEKGITQPQHDINWVKAMVDYVLEHLPDAVTKEPEVEIVSAMLEALHETVDVAGELLDLNPELKQAQLHQVAEMFKDVLTKSADRSKTRQSRAATEDFDDEEQEALEEENEAETEVFDQVAECLNSFLKKFKGGFLPVVDALLPQVMPMMEPHRSPEERRVALCIFDDVIEYAAEGGASLAYFDHFYPHILQACQDQNNDVRQAAVYGLGACAQCGGEKVRPHVPQMINVLSSVISAPGAREPENEMVTDNAISALGKMCEFQRTSFDATHALTAWLEYLPVKEDKEEACLVHETLVRMTEQNDTMLLGPANERLPKVVSIFAQVIGTDCVTEEVSQRIRGVLGRMQSSMPAEQVAALWSSIPPEHQHSLSAALAAPASPI